jgi:hypothetical protein
MIKPTSVSNLTDLCIAINAVEGADCAPEYQKQNKRVCKMLHRYMINAAERLWTEGVTLKRLTKAINAAGWEDQHFVAVNGNHLEIVDD